MRARVTTRHAHWDRMRSETGTEGITFGHDAAGAKSLKRRKTNERETARNRDLGLETNAHCHRKKHFLSGLMEACFGLEEPHDSSCA